MAGNQTSNLQEIIGCKGSEGYFKKKELLLLDEIPPILRKEQNLNKGGKAMLSYMDLTHDFNCMQVSFPITKVQHVTTEEHMSNILESQCIRARNRRKEFEDLSFWSVHISDDVVSTAFEEVYESQKENYNLMFYYSDIRKQFATSPAFKNHESRYGNFVFSFLLSDLIGLYKAQHCGGKMPMFKYLGTDLFKKEIAHYIVIHSPDSKKFDDLLQVPRYKTTSYSSPYPVYWSNENLYWRPESTSEELTVFLSSSPSIDLHHHENFKRYCVWNNLVFAFHFPEGSYLQIPREKLLENLSACQATETPYLGDTKTTKIEVPPCLLRPPPLNLNQRSCFLGQIDQGASLVEVPVTEATGTERWFWRG
ncbi:uncharacterized protein LOC142196197 [Leptodactylus fuscus]|uniref:uncharacterized protein LOC142196197 n=1 Tax=Leptodactylus fuscus TaxID=238119 RepID=UPI003F4E9BDB